MKVLNKIRLDDIITDLIITKKKFKYIERFDSILDTVIGICLRHGKEVTEENREIMWFTLLKGTYSYRNTLIEEFNKEKKSLHDGDEQEKCKVFISERIKRVLKNMTFNIQIPKIINVSLET